jgi:hypothetical protein
MDNIEDAKKRLFFAWGRLVPAGFILALQGVPKTVCRCGADIAGFSIAAEGSVYYSIAVHTKKGKLLLR